MRRLDLTIVLQSTNATSSRVRQLAIAEDVSCRLTLTGNDLLNKSNAAVVHLQLKFWLGSCECENVMT